MEIPGLTDDAGDRRIGAQHQLQVAIGRRLYAGAAGRAEGGDPRMAELEPFNLFEEGGVALVRAGPSALDIVDAQIIETFGNLELVVDRKRNVLALASIAQGRVINLNFFGNRHRLNRF